MAAPFWRGGPARFYKYSAPANLAGRPPNYAPFGANYQTDPALQIQVQVQAEMMETSSEQRKRRKARKREVRVEKKRMENQTSEKAPQAQANLQSVDEARQQKIEKRQLRKIRITMRQEAKAEKRRMEAEKQVNEKFSQAQANMQERFEAEKQTSERYLSLARKYYGMWKTLNEQCQEKSASKSQSSHVELDLEESTSSDDVRLHFSLPQAWYATQPARFSY